MNYTKMATKISELLKKGTKNTLKSVIIKGKGEGYYYDMVSNQFILVRKQAEMYFLPLEEDENGNLYFYMPYIFGSAAIILVHKSEAVFLGYN